MTRDEAKAFIKALIAIRENAIPEWEQPDSTNAYKTGDKVTYNGKTYVSICDNNVWNPTEYGWEEIVSQPSNPSVTE